MAETSETSTPVPATPAVTAAKVHHIGVMLHKEKPIQDALGNRDTPVPTHDGKVKSFPSGLVKITEAIIGAGGNPYLTPKKEVLKVAVEVLGLAPPAAPSTVPSTSSAKITTDRGATPKNQSNLLPVVSLLIGVKQLAQEDKETGFADRRKKIDEILEAYTKLVHL